MFPNTKPSKANPRGGQGFHNCLGREDRQRLDANAIKGHSDYGGSAARFFYCAKASKAERNKGLEGMEEKPIAYSDYRENVSTTKSFVSEYPDGKPRPMNKPKNNHPTVKPIALMRYLCRLITPPNGIVLDNHGGSGSTGVAALLEGFRYILIENKPEYVKIAEKRIEAIQSQGALFK